MTRPPLKRSGEGTAPHQHLGPHEQSDMPQFVNFWNVSNIDQRLRETGAILVGSPPRIGTYR
jgi:hypothetical protein